MTEVELDTGRGTMSAALDGARTTRRQMTLLALACALSTMAACDGDIRLDDAEAPSGAALAAPGSVETRRQALTAMDTGYMVEVHTCNVTDAGTNSLISMTLDIQGLASTGYANRTVGPFFQNHTFIDPQTGAEYDDHGRNAGERSGWDRYFFPDSNEPGHIWSMKITTDGKHSRPGWCWDKHYVTFVRNGQSIWTWAWEFTAPWIGEGGQAETHTFDGFSWGAPGRSIPPDLTIAGSSPDVPPAQTGSISVSTIFTTLFDCGNNIDTIFSVAKAGFPTQKRRPMWNLHHDAVGQKHCRASVLFSGLPAGGGYQVSRHANGDTEPVVDCKTGQAVIAGKNTEVFLTYLGGCPQ